VFVFFNKLGQGEVGEKCHLIPDLLWMCFRSVLVVLGIAPDSETSSQAQTTGVAPDSQNSSQAQTSEAHTGHTSNSDNVVTEKSKESSGAT
jgi:hypothetical protein